MFKRNTISNSAKRLFFTSFIISFLVGAASGAVFGVIGATVLMDNAANIANQLIEPNRTVSFLKDSGHENLPSRPTVVSAVRQLEPAVVSIVITKDVPRVSRDPFRGLFGDDFFRDFFNRTPVPPSSPPVTERRQVGGGSGFFVSSDGLIVTNKHVVADEDADYTVLLNDGTKLDATVLARDSVADLAIVKVEGDNFSTVKFGNSDNLELGETVIAIGNALGEFRNTVSVGVISGLSRSITASGSLLGPEQLVGVIQTDAAINSGNSGGPLANLSGEVIGINTAVASNGQNIGFAIPVNEVKQVVNSVKEHGRIIRPFLGVRYIIINESYAKDNQLPYNYGALLVRGQRPGETAVTSGSPAAIAGLQEDDILLEIEGEKVTMENPLAKIVAKYKVGDKINIKVYRKNKEISVKAVLVERK